MEHIIVQNHCILLLKIRNNSQWNRQSKTIIQLDYKQTILLHRISLYLQFCLFFSLYSFHLLIGHIRNSI